MRSARIAEWVLSLGTTPARAASTVGDLMEGAQGRGRLWFWTSVLQTTLSLIWRDVTADFWNVTKLAIFGIGIEALAVVALPLLVFFTAFISILVTHQVGQPHPEQLRLVSGARVGVTLLFTTVVPFVVGRWLARRSPGRELAPCIVFAAMPYVVGFLIDAASGWRLPVEFLPSDIPTTLALFLGAIVVRRQHQTRAA
jgi:hypothetical protein